MIKELKEVQLKSKSTLMATHQNRSQMLIKIPKLIIVSKICRYLTPKEIVHLSGVCSILRKAVYGPLGWKILSFQLNKCPPLLKEISLGGVRKQSYEHEPFSLSSMENEDEKYLKRERTKYKQILMKKYENYLKAKEKHEGHTEKLRAEKTHILKLRLQT